MKKQTTISKDKAFAGELAKYENQWVAITRSKTKEVIVASGLRMSDAKRAAEAKGVLDAVYQRRSSTTKIIKR